jgi:hypothetical protein
MSTDREEGNLDVPRTLDRLERTIEELASRVGDVGDQAGEHDTLIRQLAGSISQLARTVAGDDAGDASPAHPQSWLQIDDAGAAREILADLVEWVEAVYLRYPGAQLPSCWLWHPPVIEELWWLRNLHREAYTGRTATWTRAAEWHDRYRPGVVRRVREAVGDCELSRHTRGSGDRVARPVAAPLAVHAEHIADEWTATGLPPEPTPQQISQADQYEADQQQRGAYA